MARPLSNHRSLAARSGVALAAICLALAGAGATAQTVNIVPTAAEAPGPAAPVDFTGVWSRTNNDPNRPGKNWDSRPLYQQSPPYTAAAKKQHDSRDPKDEPGIHCIQASMPRMMTVPYPTQIYQRPNHILVISESNNTLRRIWLDRDKHLEDLVPTFHGDSIGRWEGKTLVVDTVGFNGKNDLDAGGTLMSPNLHVIERWTLTPGPKPQLNIEFTFEDPTVYTKVWSSKVEYAADPNTHLREYICNDNPRDFELTEDLGKALFPVETVPVEGPAVRQ